MRLTHQYNPNQAQTGLKNGLGAYLTAFVELLAMLGLCGSVVLLIMLCPPIGGL